MILEAIKRALEGQAPGDTPPPWVGWLAVCLCRHRARQDWGHGIQALLDIESVEGGVPGHPDWSYRVDWEDDGVLLLGPDEEQLWLARSRDPEWLSAWEVAHRVFNLNPRPLPEARLARWLPDRHLFTPALRMLVEGGLLRLEGEETYAMREEFERVYERIAAVDFSDARTCTWWCEHMGDVAQDPIGLMTSTTEHREWLLSLARERPESELLDALAKALPDADMIPLCEEVLRGPVDAACGTALQILQACGGPPLATVEQFIDRLDPGRHHPYSAWAAAQYLLDRGVARDRVLRLAGRFADVEVVEGYRGNPFDDNWAFLFLEHDPARALPRVRQALRSRTPMCSTSMAAVLALLDQPWCHRELLMALQEVPPTEGGEDEAFLRQGGDTSRRRYLAAALMQSQHLYARRMGMEFNPDAPPEREPGAVGFTHDEVTHANLEVWLREAMERVRPVAERLQGRLPDDYGEMGGGMGGLS